MLFGEGGCNTTHGLAWSSLDSRGAAKALQCHGRGAPRAHPERLLQVAALSLRQWGHMAGGGEQHRMCWGRAGEETRGTGRRKAAARAGSALRLTGSVWDIQGWEPRWEKLPFTIILHVLFKGCRLFS